VPRKPADPRERTGQRTNLISSEVGRRARIPTCAADGAGQVADIVEVSGWTAVLTARRGVRHSPRGDVPGLLAWYSIQLRMDSNCLTSFTAASRMALLSSKLMSSAFIRATPSSKTLMR